MRFILKTLVIGPVAQKNGPVSDHNSKRSSKPRPLFDALFGLLAAFYTAYQEFLKPEALIARLNQIKLVDYLSNHAHGLDDPDLFGGS